MKKILYSILGVLTLVIFNGLVFSEVYFNNHTSTNYLYIDFIKNYCSNIWVYTLISIMIVYILSVLLKNKSKYLYMFLLYALIIFWINSNFFQFNNVLDGKEHIDLFSIKNILNIFVTALLFVVLFIYWKKNNVIKILKLSGMVIIICYVSQTLSLYNVYNTSKYNEKKVQNNKDVFQLSNKPEDLLQFSKEKNIIYILLDTFDSEYMNEIIKEKEYREMYKDFIYYNNYASAYPTTMATGVATFTNMVYKNQKPFIEFKKDAFADNQSFFSVLKNRGWDKILYGSAESVYDSNISNYINLTNKTLDKFYIDYKNMYDVVEYKLTPYFLKNVVRKYQYKQNFSWDFEFLNIIRKGEIRYNDNKTFLLFHLNGAHPPYLVDEKMNLSNESNGIKQAKASLKLVNEFLMKLKKYDVYDNSVIVIAGDHGNRRPNALLMVKNMNKSKKDLDIKEESVSQLNMNEAFINAIDIDDFVIKESSERRFYDYIWLNDWIIGYLPVITEYRLPKNLKNKSEYKQLEKYNPPITVSEFKINHKYTFLHGHEEIPRGVFNEKLWKYNKNEACIEGGGDIWINFKNKDINKIGVLMLNTNANSQNKFFLNIVNGDRLSSEWINNGITSKCLRTDNIIRIDIRKNKEKIKIYSLGFYTDTNMCTINEGYNKVAKLYDIINISGWYHNEKTHAWGRKETELLLPLSKNIKRNKDLDIIVDGSLYFDKKGTSQNIEFYIDNELLNKYNVRPDKNINKFKVMIPKKHLKDEIVLKIKTSYETSPEKEGRSNDGRLLAFALKGIEVLTDDKTKQDKEHVIKSNNDNVEKIKFNSKVDINENGYFGKGWSSSEGTHRWSIGNESIIHLPLNNVNEDIGFNINLKPYLNSKLKEQSIKFIVGDNNTIYEGKMDSKEKVYSMNIAKKYIKDNVLTISIQLKEPVSSPSFDGKNDKRMLGVMTRAIEIKKSKNI